MAQTDSTQAPTAQVSFIVPVSADPAVLKSTLQSVVNTLASAGSAHISNIQAQVLASGIRTTITAP